MATECTLFILLYVYIITVSLITQSPSIDPNDSVIIRLTCI